jgi:kynurenine formamidase
MFQRAFASNYTALDSTAAAVITSSSSIKLVGIDYLSIGMLEDIVETHRTLFRGVSRVQRGE